MTDVGGEEDHNTHTHTYTHTGIRSSPTEAITITITIHHHDYHHTPLQPQCNATHTHPNTTAAVGTHNSHTKGSGIFAAVSVWCSGWLDTVTSIHHTYRYTCNQRVAVGCESKPFAAACAVVTSHTATHNANNNNSSRHTQTHTDRTSAEQLQHCGYEVCSIDEEISVSVIEDDRHSLL